MDRDAPAQSNRREVADVNVKAFLFIGLTVFGTQASAATYTYDITGFGPEPASGDITTSCDNCVLNANDITAWSLAGFSSKVAGSTVVVIGNGLVATPTGIFFNFNPGSTNDALFSELPNPTPNSGNANPLSVEYTNSAPGYFFHQGWVFVTNTEGAYGTEGFGNANLGPLRSTAAPEIDAGTAASGITLLLGFLMVLRGRRVTDCLAHSDRKGSLRAPT